MDTRPTSSAAAIPGPPIGAERVDEPGTAAARKDGPTAIVLEGVRKQYADGTVAVEGLTLEVPAGELLVLVGPSGSGKSTVLRMINRLVEPTTGRVLVDGEDVTATDAVALRRRMGYVIQDVGLFPHQTVEANVGTVPRLLGWPAVRVRERTAELLERVGLDPRLHGPRYPHELSGGQRQRVGVARALAAEPVVLLMDEPFSAVDPVARGRLQEEFLALQAELGTTVVLVTHDLDEAIRLGDRIAVLSQHGHLEQVAAPGTLLSRPATPFVREFVGADRAIRRLAVTPLTREMLAPVRAGDATDGAAPRDDDTDAAPRLELGASLYDALGALLTSGHDRVVVVHDGAPVGAVDTAAVLAAGRAAD